MKPTTPLSPMAAQRIVSERYRAMLAAPPTERELQLRREYPRLTREAVLLMIVTRDRMAGRLE